MAVLENKTMTSTELRNLANQVDFYRLSRKFIEDKEVPPEAQHIMYYSLGIGHHLGVVDCLKSEMNCSGEEYLTWISALPTDSEAHRKMYGYFLFGEITIMPEHINMLALAFDAIEANTQTEKSQQLTQGLIAILTAIYNEPNMYLMIRSTHRD
ncbi:formate hydrogenlyase maturation HycH family protein [Vibrio aphrogenes]|uniref:formate hydrogenlyase maturation HycH family protein n=1 Tax=Vibrio aphrogenes TaxID=1891186 RepID=UPI001E299692|nr:formate hydrogenlyase maturation HycH family protein [Vibrio aphrogenes]